jgi:PAS domain S-box-containing protein
VTWQAAALTITPFILALTVIILLVVYLLMRRRHRPGISAVVLLLLAMAEWVLMDILELASTDPAAKLLWSKLRYVGMLSMAPLWLVYILHYSGGEKKLTRGVWLLLATALGGSLLLVFTNESHGLMWRRAVPQADPLFSFLEVTYGAGILIPALYAYILVLIITALLVQMHRRSNRFYRRQIAPLLLATHLLWLALTLDFLAWRPYPQFYPMPFAMTASVLLGVWNTFRHRIGDIMPVAREAIIESMSDSVFVLDLHDRVVDLNPAAQCLVGQAALGTVGQPIEQIWPDWATLNERLQGKINNSETMMLDLGNERRTYDVRVSSLADKHGQFISRVIVLRDITALKAIHEALRTAQGELERRVQKRTAELAQANTALQIEIAERQRTEKALERYAAELQRSNQELQQFAYVASHDLQEPLRMVTSYVQLLARRYKGQLDADADDFIAFAVDGATRMQQLIKGLLAYSRVGTRGQPFAPTDCQSALDQALADLKVTLEENGATVTHDPLPTVMADATQLGQLFQNLIGNAVKFRNDRPSQIHVGAKQRDDEWLFWVQDNGIGIEPQYTERIFLIFQRLHTRDEYPGTGIGLSICKRIVERHDGRIWVESEPGQGSRFYFTIPKSKGRQWQT